MTLSWSSSDRHYADMEKNNPKAYDEAREAGQRALNFISECLNDAMENGVISRKFARDAYHLFKDGSLDECNVLTNIMWELSATAMETKGFTTLRILTEDLMRAFPKIMSMIVMHESRDSNEFEGT